MANNGGVFNNNANATFRKSVVAGTSTVQWAFNNSGTVDIKTGTLNFTGSGNYGGTTTIASGLT